MSEATIAAVVIAFFGALFASVPQTIAALAAYRAAKQVGKKTDENTAVTMETKATTDAIAVKTNAIAITTDGHLSKVTDRLDAANQEIANLNKAQSNLQELVAQLLNRENTNGDELHTITEALKNKE